MYHHVKKLMYTVKVGTPDPRFGNMLLEQFGGANGELAAAMQYSIQGLNCDDPARKDMLMDIGPGKSLGYRIEAGRQLGYQRLRNWRNRFRHHLPTPASKKLGMAAPH